MLATPHCRPATTDHSGPTARHWRRGDDWAFIRGSADAGPRAFNPMTNRFELVSLALPVDCPPESVPSAVGQLISAAWPGMSRAQLVDRARRLDMHASLRVQPGIGPDGLTQFRLALSFENESFELIAYVRRVIRRRTGAQRQKPSLPPARDIRQQSLF